MLGAMAGSFSRMAFSNDAMVACAASGFRKTSVLPHHTMTIRESLFFTRNCSMSSITCSASSILFLPDFTFGPCKSFDVVLAENRLPGDDFFDLRPHGLQEACSRERRRWTRFGSSCRCRYPSRRRQGHRYLARGTKSLIAGTRLSVRLPRRIVPICVSEPIGFAMFFLYGFNACDKRGADCAQAGNQYTQLSSRLFDLYIFPNHTDLLRFRHLRDTSRGLSSWRASNPDSCGL